MSVVSSAQALSPNLWQDQSGLKAWRYTTSNSSDSLHRKCNRVSRALKIDKLPPTRCFTRFRRTNAHLIKPHKLSNQWINDLKPGQLSHQKQHFSRWPLQSPNWTLKLSSILRASISKSKTTRAKTAVSKALIERKERVLWVLWQEEKGHLGLVTHL